MNAKTKARCETRASVLKAIAHPVRLYILEVLEHETYCVRDLTGMIGLDISTVSKHLSILKNAGFVQLEKKGKQVFYSLRMPCALNFLECVETVLQRQAQDKMDAL